MSLIDVAALEARIAALEEQAPLDTGIFFDMGDALAWLLTHEVVHCFGAEGGLVSLSNCMGNVNRRLCMDEWVDVPFDQIKPLYRAMKADPEYGVIKWCCSYMGARPIKSIEENMRAKGLWTDEMEALT